ncbi:MAG: LysR family transcriptional regulator [Clostridiales bacterium]|nr:LysR family transcriptional regulator [Clostridiales bacterium]
MTQKQIQYFKAVCTSGSVTKAAETLFISRPVISRAIHDLESEVGAVLFIRTNDGLLLTEHGKALYTLFAEFTKSYELTIDKIHHMNKFQISRVLRIGITPTNGKCLIPEVYNLFNKTYPDICLYVTEASAAESADLTISGDVDFFITPHEVKGASVLGTRKLYESQFVFCTSKSGPLSKNKKVSLDEIAGLPMASLCVPIPSLLRLSNIVLSTSQQDLVRMAIAGGAVNAVLPYEMVEDWEGLVSIRLEPPLRYNVNLIWNKSVPHNSAFDDFMNYIDKNDVFKSEIQPKR